MVYFTCQHCGESVNKPKVEKHYLTKCRFKTPYLTCVDCLKDFNDQEYVHHTQCISEAERYSAKGTIFKEPVGKKKQAKYIEVVQSLLNSKNLTCVQKKLLEVCASHDNVPRKLNKFQNFMNNVSRQVRHTKKDEEDVFKLLESAWKSESQEHSNTSISPAKQNSGEKTIEKNKEIINNCRSTKNENIINNLNESDSTLNTNHESKKTKNKKQKDVQTTVDEKIKIDCNNTSEESKENINGLTKKQLKKQKKYEKYLMELQTAGKNEENEGEEISYDERLQKAKKKSKKLKNISNSLDNGLNDQHMEIGKTVEVVEEMKQKKNKKLKMCDVVNGQIDGASTDICKEDNEENYINNNNKSKKKSKQLKHLTNPEHNVNGETDISSAPEIHLKKNKKRKMEQAVETNEEMKKPRITEDDNGNQSTFDWTDVILRILASRPDKELSIKRLGKKVIDEYQTTSPDHRSYEDLLAKFNKKVKKTKGVRVLKDKAKLVE